MPTPDAVLFCLVALFPLLLTPSLYPRISSLSLSLSLSFSLSLSPSRLFYLLMRPHRFAVNLGYGSDASDSAMTGTVLLFTSMFIELGMEVAVDSAAVPVEHANGIDLDRFWDMWRVSPGNFFGLHVSSSLMAILISLWSFSTLPSPFFCTSEHDPCSCNGGVFTILETFCNARGSSDALSDSDSGSNETASTATSNTTLGSIKASAKKTYVGILESLEESSAVVLVSIAVIVVVSLVFFAARSQIIAAYAEKKREEVETHRVALAEENERIQEQNERIQEQNEKIQEQNKKIQDQLMLTQLNAKQVAIVEANSLNLDEQVPAMFKLNWRDLLFEARLGSGSFGDCFKGRYVCT